ncbi:MAG: hypothetical protein WC325_11875 [Candidatus Bathyarchaeia archaeon]
MSEKLADAWKEHEEAEKMPEAETPPPKSDVQPKKTVLPKTSENVSLKSGLGWIVASLLGGVLIGTYLILLLF